MRCIMYYMADLAGNQAQDDYKASNSATIYMQCNFLYLTRHMASCRANFKLFPVRSLMAGKTMVSIYHYSTIRLLNGSIS